MKNIDFQLSWSHYLLLMKIQDIEERKFYLELVNLEKYSKRELERQISAALYERSMIGHLKLSSLVLEISKN